MLCCDRCIENNAKKYFRTTGNGSPRKYGECECCNIPSLCIEGNFTDNGYVLVGHQNQRQRDQMQMLAETLELEEVERGTSQGDEYYIVSTNSGEKVKIQSVRDYERTSIYVTKC